LLDEFEALDAPAKEPLAMVTIDFSSALVPMLERAVAERSPVRSRDRWRAPTTP
jgi:hypothetical protein